MAEYVNITQTDFEEFLESIGGGWVQLSLPGVVELVYGKRVKNKNMPLSLRIYSGINPDGDSRNVGKDAIRVDLFTKNKEGKPIYLRGSKRVHRVKGWRQNLIKRLDHWGEFMPQRLCHKCGLPMLVRENKTTKEKFFGCCDYPNCKATADYADLP